MCVCVYICVSYVPLQGGSHPHRYQVFEKSDGGNRKRVKKEDGKERVCDGSHREGGVYLDDDVVELRVESDMFFHEYAQADLALALGK